MRTRIRIIAFALAFMTIGTACTPEQILLYLESTEPTRDVLTDEELLRLRMCESTDNYEATNPSGKYRGAYQFDQTVEMHVVDLKPSMCADQMRVRKRCWPAHQ